MNIAIVGCGLNSHYHIRFANEYPGLALVGVVDKDRKKAEECASRYGVKGVCSSIKELTEVQKPDAVHILTPPTLHYVLAREAIESKCHVLVEKPLALNLRESEELYSLAEDHGVRLCTMHNHFFDPCMAKARTLVADGKIGDIVNVESYYGLNTRIDAFKKYPAPNVLPWIYSLPGGVFQDFMAHPLYVMLPYTGKPEEVVVMEKSFGELPQNISDELKILIKGEKCFGTVTVSFRARPHLHFLRIYGSKMMVTVDFNTMTTTCHPVSKLPKAAQKATYNLSESWQLLSATVSNVWNFGRGKLRPYQGMKILIHQFYDSINGKDKVAVPVSKENALTVIETMDEIFKQIKSIHLNSDPIIPDEEIQMRQGRPRILVTGATGFLGIRLVEMLVQKGYPVRALVRKLSNIDKLSKLNVEIFFGDVACLESLEPSFEGIDYVIHAAADTSGSKEESELSTIQGTQNVINLCRRFEIKKLVYISSCSVYGVADYKRGYVVTEESSLERFSLKRGYYSHSKLEAEKIILECIQKSVIPVVCLRPATIYGPSGEIFTPMMGFALGHKLFAVIGNGEFVLPFVYIDNLVEAIMLAMNEEASTGRVYNVVDSDKMTKKQYIDWVLKRLYPKSYFINIPYRFLHTIVFIQEVMFKVLRRRPFLTGYRLSSSQKNIVYDASRIRNELKWDSSMSAKDSVEKILEYELLKR